MWFVDCSCTVATTFGDFSGMLLATAVVLSGGAPTPADRAATAYDNV